MIGHLLDGLQAAVDQAATPEDLGKHLEGIAAIMESHFRFEERKLLGVLEGLALDADVGAVFGPLSPGQVASGHGGAWRSAPGAALALQRAHTSRATTVRSPPWT